MGKLGIAYYNAKPLIEQGGCGEVYHGDELWKCAFGLFRYPLLKTPYAFVASTYDSFQLDHVDGTATLQNKTWVNIANSFARRTLEDATGLPQVKGGTAAALLPSCYNHMQITSKTYFSEATSGVSMAAFLKWVVGNFTESAKERQMPFVASKCAADGKGINC